MTGPYEETGSDLPAIRRAKALKKILEKMSARIDDGELIAGKTTSNTHGDALLPEVREWCLDEMESLTIRQRNRFWCQLGIVFLFTACNRHIESRLNSFQITV
jgi:hypothetical protein